MELLKAILISAVLVYGAVVDYRKREIPNIVPILIFIFGFALDLCFLSGIVELGIIALIFTIANWLTRGSMPGGDFKLLCAMAYAVGLSDLTLTLVLAGLGAVAIGIIKGKNISRNIPLCTYIAPAYIALQVGLVVMRMC